MRQDEEEDYEPTPQELELIAQFRAACLTDFRYLADVLKEHHRQQDLHRRAEARKAAKL